MARSHIQLKKQENKKSSGNRGLRQVSIGKKLKKGWKSGGGSEYAIKGVSSKNKVEGSTNPLPTMSMPIKNVIIL